MLAVHEREISRERAQRGILEREYDAVQAEIGNLFAQRAEAERQGVLDAVDAKLATLKMRRDELQQTIQRLHDEGNDWIDHVLGCFELAKLASEAILYGSPEAREAILKALGSNYVVQGKTLVWELPSPFREKVQNPDCTVWGERGPRLLSLRLRDVAELPGEQPAHAKKEQHIMIPDLAIPTLLQLDQRIRSIRR